MKDFQFNQKQIEVNISDDKSYLLGLRSIPDSKDYVFWFGFKVLSLKDKKLSVCLVDREDVKSEKGLTNLELIKEL